MPLYEKVYRHIYRRLLSLKRDEITTSWLDSVSPTTFVSHSNVIMTMSINLKAILLTLSIKYNFHTELINVIGTSLFSKQFCIICKTYMCTEQIPTFTSNDSVFHAYAKYHICSGTICSSLQRHFGIIPSSIGGDITATKGRLTKSVTIKNGHLEFKEDAPCIWLRRYNYITILCKTVTQIKRPIELPSILYTNRVRKTPSWRGNRGVRAQDYTGFVWSIDKSTRKISLLNAFHIFNHHRGFPLYSPHCFNCGMPIFTGRPHIISIDYDTHPELLVKVFTKIKKNRAILPPSKYPEDLFYNTYWALLQCGKCQREYI